jgi:hypothetical protein
MPQVRLEPMIPVFERAKTVHALDRAATVIAGLVLHFHWNRMSVGRCMLSECLFWSLMCYAYWCRGTRSLVCPLTWSEEGRWGRYPLLRKCLTVVLSDLRFCSIIKIKWQTFNMLLRMNLTGLKERSIVCHYAGLTEEGECFKGTIIVASVTKLHASKPLNESSPLLSPPHISEFTVLHY